MAALVLVCWALLAAPPQEERQELIERIVELHREMQQLLEKLPPEVREELLERLAEAPSTTESSSEAPATEMPSPELGSAMADAPPPPPVAATGSADEPAARSAADSPAAATEPRCARLSWFDSNGDGEITGGDRRWRHLYLWQDRNGDGDLEEGEVRHLYEHGIRRVTLQGTGYTTRKDQAGDVWPDSGRLSFQLIDERSSALLVVDADGLARSEGVELFDADGEPLSGYGLFDGGLSVRQGEAVERLVCGDL